MPFDDSGQGGGRGREPARNVLGGVLVPCSLEPMTGFFRNGCCDTSAEDVGSHTVCVGDDRRVPGVQQARRQRPLDSRTRSTASPGCRQGDRWCLCAPRWQQALDAGQAPQVVLEATHEGALDWCGLDDLKRHAVRPS